MNTCQLILWIIKYQSNSNSELLCSYSNPLIMQKVSDDFFASITYCFVGIQVQYSVSLDSAAGLPSWLTLLQSDNQDAASPAFLYGTPAEDDLGQITLNVSTKLSDFVELDPKGIFTPTPLYKTCMSSLSLYTLTHAQAFLTRLDTLELENRTREMRIKVQKPEGENPPSLVITHKHSCSLKYLVILCCDSNIPPFPHLC